MKPGYPELLKVIEEEIKKNNFAGNPQNLYDPLNYIIGLGGKRIRPVLALMGCQLFSENFVKAIPAALCVEVFHNFSLIHDDIMDKAPIRRGSPTVHEKWDMHTAILSGDLMLVKAYEILLRTEEKHWPQLLKVFNKTASEVCEGQQMDMNFESINSVTEEEYLEMIRLKTSVLLGCSLKMGAIVSNACEDDLERIYKFGINMGLGFQLMDDYLDVFGTKELIGKQPGGDILSGKKTILAIHSAEKDKQYNDIQNSEMSDEDRIQSVRSVFVSKGADVYLKELAANYFNKASQNLDEIKVPASQKKGLSDLLDYLGKRDF